MRVSPALNSAEHRVLLVGLKPKVERVLNKLGVIELTGLNTHFRDRLSALQHAATTISGPDEA